MQTYLKQPNRELCTSPKSYLIYRPYRPEIGTCFPDYVINIFLMEPRKLNALIFGATGAVGRELVKHLANNNRWGEIVCVVRQELPEWEPIKNRLRIVRVDNLDSLVETEKWNFPNTNSVFCCLGSQTKHGNDTFIKVDKTYPLWIANIALKNSKTHCNEEIKHYSLVSSVGSNPNSWFLYPRTKGEV